jgi:hypothetical protein
MYREWQRQNVERQCENVSANGKMNVSSPFFCACVFSERFRTTVRIIVIFLCGFLFFSVRIANTDRIITHFRCVFNFSVSELPRTDKLYHFSVSFLILLCVLEKTLGKIVIFLCVLKKTHKQNKNAQN